MGMQVLDAYGALKAAGGGGGAPVTEFDASAIISGLLTLERGGTEADLSATGPGFIKQASMGAALSVGSIAQADLPVMTGDSGSGGAKGAVPAPASGDALKALFGSGIWKLPGVGTLIARQTVSSGTSVTVSGIPQTHQMLMIALQTRSAVAATVDLAQMQLGGGSLDSTAGNYYSYSLTGTGSSVTMGADTNNAAEARWRWYTSGGNAPSGASGFSLLFILNYANASAVKRMVALTSGMSGTGSSGVWAGAQGGWWYNTSAAVERFLLDFDSAAAFAAPSEYTVWGISG